MKRDDESCKYRKLTKTRKVTLRAGSATSKKPRHSKRVHHYYLPWISTWLVR